MDDATFLRMVINDTPQAGPVAGSLAEMLDGRIGVVDSAGVMGRAPSRLSEDRAAYRADLERKRDDGRPWPFAMPALPLPSSTETAPGIAMASRRCPICPASGPLS